MKILYYDCFSGISGDMNLGAMIDLGVDGQKLRDELNKLHLPGWNLHISREERHGIAGTKVSVITDPIPGAGDLAFHPNDHGENHRRLKDIEGIISRSGLNIRVKTQAVKIFRLMAESEAIVHNTTPDDIHFHEIGAVDAIIDIVGAAICLEELAAEKIFVSPLEMGSGTVKCAHGTLPVPAPATVQLLKNFPVHLGGVPFEATTPTGGAIIAAIAEPAPQNLNFSIIKAGYGIGQKDNPHRPNMLRVYLAEAVASQNHEAFLVECNIDDMNPEITDYIAAQLYAAGVPDVFYTQIMMKKSRPAYQITVICDGEHLAAVKRILFTESTTIGLRVLPFHKEALSRRFTEEKTPFGMVKVKRSYFDGREVSVKPEADQCAAIAREKGIPMKDVMRVILAAIQKDHDA
jgi:uncharacterized protein (TIGR00299 family) protein